ncbi:hypothetical protein EJ04DRAFT_431052 [Polyplosphaeria fusca]|uniref:Uncharacterized protein n=1 Tax=Polyplosphaeria fusca TaxID=682080 RepID=A0A9P4R3L5_9PLEO|nr:hypothetical protein EJ04DRAFT_431052 [Polyplosphaeria fusca]
MRNHNGIRVVCLIAPPLILLPLSILTFALERVSRSLLAYETSRNWRSGSWSITLNHQDIDIRVNPAPTAAILGIALASYFVSIVSACGIWELRRVEGTARHQRSWSWVVVLLNAGVAVASIAVLAWGSALLSQEKWKSGADAFQDERKSRETFMCGIAKFYPSEGWARPACGVAQATRFLLIPLALAAVLTLWAAGVLVRDRGGAKWLAGGKGRYGAFPSTIEMELQHPAAPKNNSHVNERPAFR